MSKYLCLVSLLLAVAIVDSEMFTSKLMSSKTKYNDVSSKDLPLPDDYTPLKAFFLIRQATSSSTDYTNENMRRGLKAIQDKIKQKAESAGIPVEDYVKQLGKEVEEFIHWDPSPIPYNGTTLDKDLTPFGIYEMTSFGFRMKSKLPGIFGRRYDPKNCRVLSLFSSRSRKSGQVFLETVYPNDKFEWKKIPYTEKEDYTLNEDKLKEKDPQKQKYNDDWENWQQEYKDSVQFQQVRQRFADKLGFDLEDVDYEMVQCFWETCRWDRLAFDAQIVHCKFITAEDHETLLAFDEKFWHNFVAHPANPFNYTLSCGVIHHSLEFLKSDISGPKSALYFANRSNIASMHYALGLVNEIEPFISSKTMPFMANIAAVLFQHDNHPEDEPVVAFYMNESLLNVPMPDGRKYELAPLSLVVQKLDSYVNAYCGASPYKKPDFS